MRVDLTLQQLEPIGIEPFLHLAVLELLLLQQLCHPMVFLNRLDILLHRMFHIVKDRHELTEIVPVFYMDILSREIGTGDALRLLAELPDWLRDGLLHHAAHLYDDDEHNQGEVDKNKRQHPEERELLGIRTRASLYGQLQQPAGILFEVILPLIVFIEMLQEAGPVHAVRQHLITECRILLIGIPDIPGTGIAFRSDDFIVKRKRIDRTLRMVNRLLERIPCRFGTSRNIAVEGKALLLHRLHKGLAGAVFIEELTVVSERIVHREHGEAGRDQYDEYDHSRKALHLPVDGHTPPLTFKHATPFGFLLHSAAPREAGPGRTTERHHFPR